MSRLIYTGIRNMSIGDADEVALGNGLSLVRPSETLIAEEDRPMFTQLQFEDARRASRYIMYRYELPLFSAERDAAHEQADIVFRSGLTAIQVIKPVQTLGIFFRAYESDGSVTVEQFEYRHSTDAGEWSRLKLFDAALLPDVIAMIPRVKAVLEGTNAERKNAVTLLQLGLESYHPLIAGMLWVTGMEAIFDSGDRYDFKKKLCACLGPDTLVFPDWNDLTGPLPYTVQGIAIDLYMLRNKIAHGVDLRKAANDKSTPVDLLRSVRLHSDSEATSYALLLSQAALHLLCQVIQKTI